MRFSEEDGYLILNNGRRIYCNLDTISLNANGELVYGSDGYVDDNIDALERREIAEYAIAKWKKYGGIE